MKKVFFFLTLPVKRAILLTHDWPSGCLPTACAIEKLSFCLMASRFEIVDENVIEELKDKCDNENTKNSKEYWKIVFQKCVNERNFQANLEECKSDGLDQRSSQVNRLRNSVILPPMSLTSYCNGSS